MAGRFRSDHTVVVSEGKRRPVQVHKELAKAPPAMCESLAEKFPVQWDRWREASEERIRPQSARISPQSTIGRTRIGTIDSSSSAFWTLIHDLSHLHKSTTRFGNMGRFHTE